jgi:plasmid segregation protein ParM
MKVIGVEAANSFVKSKSDEKELTYLNTVRERSELEEDINGTATGEFYYIDGVKYSVGDASTAAASSSARGTDRYSGTPYYIEMLIAIAKHAKNGDKLRVVTGVPAQHYKAKGVEEAIVTALRKRHTVGVGSETNLVTFDVEDVIVMLQPLGTLTYLVYNTSGYNEGGEALLSKKKLIVDIGFGTTDCAELEGSTLVSRYGFGTAMRNVYEKIEEQLRTKNSELISADFSVFELEQVLRSGNIFEYGNVEYDLTDYHKKALKSVADAILAKIGNKYQLDKYSAVIFTGGGIEALRDHLGTQLDSSVKKNALSVDKPQLANAIGYFVYGKLK